MKFYGFPYLVQKEILQQMKLPELIVSGQVSKNHKAYVRMFLKDRFKKIDTICYHSKGPDTCNISTTNCRERVDFLVMKPSLDDKTLEPKTRTSMFGMELECSTTDPLTIFCTLGDGPTVLPTIHDQIYDFFGDSVAYEVRMAEGEYIPQLHHITSSILKLTSLINLREYSENLPPQNFLSLYNASNFRLAVPHFPNTEVLHIRGFRDRDETLNQFNGRELVIKLGDLTQYRVMKCLKRWISGEGYKNLEFLNIDFPHNRNHFFEEFDIREFEADFDPPVHPSWNKESSPIFQEIVTFKPRNFTSRNYIVRESDGHVAYIYVTNHGVILAVWNLTLDQLREYKPQPSNNIKYHL